MFEAADQKQYGGDRGDKDDERDPIFTRGLSKRTRRIATTLVANEDQEASDEDSAEEQQAFVLGPCCEAGGQTGLQ